MDGITSSWRTKWSTLWDTTVRRGPTVTLQLLYRALRHRLVDQWQYVYFEKSLTQGFAHIKIPKGVHIRRAVPGDEAAIKRDLFPLITPDIENDKRYLSFLGNPAAHCFIAIVDDLVVHYTWVFMNAYDSPLRSTPFDSSQIQPGDVYIGPAFTANSMRGVWIYPAVLATIWEELSQEPGCKRALLFVSPHNRGAVAFFQRLGFQCIVQPSSMIRAHLHWLRRMTSV